MFTYPLLDNPRERPTNYLVAAVIDKEVPQLEELKSNLNTAWHLQKPFHITPCSNRVANNLFMIRFECDQDLRFILENAAWVVKNKFIAFESPHKLLANEGINVSPITVQFRYLPEEHHNADMAKLLGNIVGETMFREGQQVNFIKEASFLRVRVKVDITLPLIHKLKLPVHNGNNGWTHCIYERVHRRCRRCGRIGHVKRECKWSRNEISKALNELRKRIRDRFGEDIEIGVEDEAKGDVKVNAKKHTALVQWFDGPTGSDPYNVIEKHSSCYGEDISNENDTVAVTSQTPNQVRSEIVQNLNFYHGQEIIQPNTVDPQFFSDQYLVAASNNQQALITQEFKAPWLDDNSYRIQEGLFNHDASGYCSNWYPQN